MSPHVVTVFLETIKSESKLDAVNGWQPEEIDGTALAQKIEDACNVFLADGFAISSIVPIISGGISAIGYVHKQGFSYTSGVIIVATKML